MAEALGLKGALGVVHAPTSITTLPAPWDISGGPRDGIGEIWSVLVPSWWAASLTGQPQ
jgi:hypothetical protein